MIASLNTPLIEEIFRGSFTKVPPPDRSLKCRQIFKNLCEVDLNEQSTFEIVKKYTSAPQKLVESDVANLFSDIVVSLLEQLIRQIDEALYE